MKTEKETKSVVYIRNEYAADGCSLGPDCSPLAAYDNRDDAMRDVVTEFGSWDPEMPDEVCDFAAGHLGITPVYHYERRVSGNSYDGVFGYHAGNCAFVADDGVVYSWRVIESEGYNESDDELCGGTCVFGIEIERTDWPASKDLLASLGL